MAENIGTIGTFGHDPEFKRTFAFGKIADRGDRKINAVEVEVALRKHAGRASRTIDGGHVSDFLEFTASGSIKNGPGTDSISCGQNLEEIARHRLPFNDATFRRILALWRHWHLNDIKSGTRLQMAVVAEAKAEALTAFKAAGYQVEDGTYGYKLDAAGARDYRSGTHFYTWAGFAGYYEWECAVLKTRGLFEVPFGPEVANANGVPTRDTYKFGHAWLVEPLTPEALAEIVDLLSDSEPAKARITAFLAGEAA